MPINIQDIDVDAGATYDLTASAVDEDGNKIQLFGMTSVLVDGTATVLPDENPDDENDAIQFPEGEFEVVNMFTHTARNAENVAYEAITRATTKEPIPGEPREMQVTFRKREAA